MIAPGVSERRNSTFCILTVPSSGSGTSVIEPSAWYCSFSITSRMSKTGAMAASAFSKAARTSSRECRAIQEPTAASSSSAWPARPDPVSNHGSSISSGRPTRRITRSAIDWADVETATHLLSLVR